MVWFPELFYRFEAYEQTFPGVNASVCEVSSIVLDNRTENEFCGNIINEKVYWHTILVGLACIPTSLWLPLCVHRLGAKFFLGKFKFK